VRPPAGTPIQNSLDDMLSLFMFLQYKPFDDPKTFHKTVGGGSKSYDSFTGDAGGTVPLKVAKMHSILNPIILRRRKDSKKADGTPIVQLPTKTVSVAECEFSDNEREFYDQLESRMASRFKKMMSEDNVWENYTNVLAMIARLRQACNHPHMVTKYNGFVAEGNSLLEELDEAGIKHAPKPPPADSADRAQVLPPQLTGMLERLKDAIAWGPPLVEMCPVCMDNVGEGDGDAVTTLCGHVFCRDCIQQYRDNGGAACPTCRKPMENDPFTSLSLVHEAILTKWPPPVVKPEVKPDPDPESEPAAAAAAPPPPPTRDQWLGSAKLRLLMKQIEEFTRANSEQKCIVFSTFTTFLSLCETHFKQTSRRGGGSTPFWRRVDGSMSVDQRQQALQVFRSDERVSVLLMSLKAGSCGLNLTCAQNVVLCEPWWNPMPERQVSASAPGCLSTRAAAVGFPRTETGSIRMHSHWLLCWVDNVIRAWTASTALDRPSRCVQSPFVDKAGRELMSVGRWL
jgi:DNA repair protein RAD5